MNVNTDQGMKNVYKLVQESIKRDWGNGWRNLGGTIKQAVITEKFFDIFTSRDDESRYSVKELREYNAAVLLYCGLREEIDL